MNLLYCWLGLFVHVNLIVRYGCEPIVSYFLQSLWCVSNHRNERINFLISIQYLWMVHVQKKKLGLRGEETPEHYIREDLSRRTRKPLNPCPTLTWGAPLPLWVRAGTFLSCFGMAACEGIFLSQPEIRSHQESSPGPEECYWGHLTSPARHPFAWFMFKSKKH